MGIYLLYWATLLNYKKPDFWMCYSTLSTVFCALSFLWLFVQNLLKWGRRLLFVPLLSKKQQTPTDGSAVCCCFSLTIVVVFCFGFFSLKKNALKLWQLCFPLFFLLLFSHQYSSGLISNKGGKERSIIKMVCVLQLLLRTAHCSILAEYRRSD